MLLVQIILILLVTGHHELAEAADFVVAEGTSSDLEALGWHEIDAIKAAITPFGMTGPRRDWRASASVLLAMGGYTYLMGDEGRTPLTLPGHYVEYQSGQYAYITGSACLFDDSRQKRAIDVSMLETVLSLSQFTTVMWTCGGQVRSRHGSSFGVIYPINYFPCADGWFHVNVVPAFWGPFTKMLGRPELEEDPRFDSNGRRLENREALDLVIAECLGSLTRAEVQRRAEQARVPTGILQALDEVLADPHLEQRNFWCDVDGVRSPSLGFRTRGDAPVDLSVGPIEVADGLDAWERDARG